MTGFSYVMKQPVGLMIRVNLLRLVSWYVRQIVLRIRPRPWAALRLFMLMPFTLLRAGFMIPAFSKQHIEMGVFLT